MRRHERAQCKPRRDNKPTKIELHNQHDGGLTRTTRMANTLAANSNPNPEEGQIGHDRINKVESEAQPARPHPQPARPLSQQPNGSPPRVQRQPHKKLNCSINKPYLKQPQQPHEDKICLPCPDIKQADPGKHGSMTQKPNANLQKQSASKGPHPAQHKERTVAYLDDETEL
ncbi:hypothetical protein E3N88_34324 [Mikania micrantha]|uniref:Uncharacterized protein n=1 Tax=Mikania micrantha TaxID=192012 RepID=A0A5N6LXT1_9ASTR|nr:hypothetical protein E3N88_34324 [Mikania micrantha]